MSPLKLSNPFRRTDAALSLRQRAAGLKSDLLNLTARPALPNPLPAPGSPEAIAAWAKARTDFDRLTYISEAEYAALRVGDTGILWTTAWVRAAQRGDFTRFATHQMAAAKAVTADELADLLVITTRRDLRFAEAERQTAIRELYALAYPEGEDPEPLPEQDGDDAHVVIAEHRAAYAALKPLSDAAKETTTDYETFAAAEAEPYRIQVEAFGELIDTRATTVGGLVALAAYLPGAVFDATCVEVEEDARRALRSICNGVLKLAESGALAIDRPVSDEPDPIHATIAESYRAEDKMKAFGLDPASTSRPQWFLRERALTEAQSAAQAAVWRTTPTTRAGRLALLDYARFQVALYTGGETDPDVPAYLFRDIMSAVTAAFEADCAPASHTATHDLSGCDLAQLARLYETWEGVFHHLTGAGAIPCFTADRRSGFTPAGDVLDREYERAGAFLGDIADEVRRRTTATAEERHERLGVLIRHELNTNGRPVNEALLSELNAQHDR